MTTRSRNTSKGPDLESLLKACADREPESLAQIIDDMPVGDAAVVDEVLAALWRRIDRSESADASALRQIAGDLQRRHLAASWDLRRAAAADNELTPLQQRLLSAIAQSPASPSVLARYFAVRQEHVVRQVRRLIDLGLVTKQAHPEDARRRIYAPASASGVDAAQPSANGAAAQGDGFALEASGFSRHLDRFEFGVAHDDEQFAREAFRRRVRARLDSAAANRRRGEPLDAVADELAELVGTCRAAHEGSLELLTLRELATTLRQAGFRKKHTTTLREMKSISSGARSDMSRWALLAKGHYEYERGKLATQQDDVGGLRHLVVASSIFDDLADHHEDDGVTRWLAWSTYATGDWLRRRNLVDQALPFAGKATQRFVEQDDDFGVVNALVLAGFCLRVRGDFSSAETILEAASRLATEQRFPRVNAEALMQLGEAQRARGNLDAAHDTLRRAAELSQSTGHVTAEGFARSSLGAWAYDTEDFRAAVGHFDRAQRLFQIKNHQVGLALNLRRSAVTEIALSQRPRGRDDRREQGLRQLGTAQRRFREMGLEVGVVMCRIDRSVALLSSDSRGHQVRGAVDKVLAWFSTRGVPGAGLDPIRVKVAARDPWAPPSLTGLAASIRELDMPQAEPLEHIVQHVNENVSVAAGEPREDLLSVFKLTGDPPPSAPLSRIDRMGSEPARIVVDGDDDARLVGLAP